MRGGCAETAAAGRIRSQARPMSTNIIESSAWFARSVVFALGMDQCVSTRQLENVLDRARFNAAAELAIQVALFAGSADRVAESKNCRPQLPQTAAVTLAS